MPDELMPITPSWTEIVFRLTATLIAGILIGINRERGGHAAGLRTNVLVSLAACLSMIQANLLLSTSQTANGSMDVLRLPLGILTGVGFIGGGAILRRRDVATGVTTAATLWLMTAIGLCFRWWAAGYRCHRLVDRLCDAFATEGIRSLAFQRAEGIGRSNTSIRQ
ncbi:MgtC/SapB family protein [Rhizobium sp.]|uniref:MgtC/SapB family protein n=1 Tax=Rhizobium sp. TaxID=391 RepID=UPI0039184837